MSNAEITACNDILDLNGAVGPLDIVRRCEDDSLRNGIRRPNVE
jgi:hypothetical protein